MFNADSNLVKMYADKVKSGETTLAQVPNLFNLREEVGKLI